ncbi:MAG: hypothetical protein K0S65_2858, partial [Labilithrix sp.]|nr:hypothetical protein [Labilithrix sp.]
MRRALSSVTAIAALTLATVEASAEGEPVATVVIAGDDAEVAIVRAGVGEQLERLGVVVEAVRESSVSAEEIVRPRPSGGAVIARVWIDSRSEHETILYVTDQTASRVLVRHFPRDGRAEIAREAVMAVVQTNVDALLHGGTIGVSQSEAREELGLTKPMPIAPCPPPPSARPPPPAPVRTTLGLALSYEVGAYAASTVEHGPVAAIELTRPFGGRSYGLALSGQYRFPITATEAPATLRLESGAFRLTGVAAPFRAGPVEVRFFGGGGIDVVRAEPGLVRIVDATLRPRSRVDAVFRAGVGLRAPLGIFPKGAVELDLALDVAPFIRSYSVSREGGRSDLLGPWAVRPLML